MRTRSWVLGYHGCGRKVAGAVLGGSTGLRASANDYDWLGTGIYFWETSARRALQWAHALAARPRRGLTRIHEPAVVGAVIDPGNCLDLLESESIRLVEQAYRDLKAHFRASSLSLPTNAGTSPGVPLRRLDCAVINYLHERRKYESLLPFDSVRAAFIEGETLYEGAGFHSHTHIQLCAQ